MQGEYYKKIYLFINNAETTEIKKINGVKASVTSKLTINDFRDCLYKKIKQVGTM